MGAILLGVGVNMFTVILGHLIKSFPSSMRSEVLSGFAVQTTVLQLMGKGIFPLVEYVLHYVFGLENTLLRYRIHMSICTIFCFFGVFALLLDRMNVQSSEKSRGDAGGIIKYQQKHSDVVDEFQLEEELQSSEIELATPASSNIDDSTYDVGEPIESFSENSSSSSFLNEPAEPLDHATTAKSRTILPTEDGKDNSQKGDNLLTTITLTFALLLQSIATTILTILWPLLAHDRFNLSSHTFGILLFISSAMSTGAVAAFPIIEKIERIGGRVRCSAFAFGLGSLLCLVFCFCSFGNYWGVETNIDEDVDNGVDVQFDTESRILPEGKNTVQQQIQSRNQILFHALSAMAFQSALCFLEPSLKSILSLHNVVNSSSTSPKGSSLGGKIGFMQSLGSIGGMIGNLGGTSMYKMSKDYTSNGNQYIFQGGSLPFVVVAALMAVSSLFIWRLDEPRLEDKHVDCDEGASCVADIEKGNAGESDLESQHGKELTDGCCLALRETTYDLKLD